MKPLIPPNTGGGVQPDPKPAATMNSDGALVINSAADALIGGQKWRVFYEESPTRTPAIELIAAGATDKGAYAVTRSNVSRTGGSTAKVSLRSLKSRVDNFDAYIGRYRVQKMAQGLRLVRSDT